MPRYSQHFLINRHAAERIVDSLNLRPEEEVLEIGAGKGGLTALLLQKKARVTAVEIDPPMVEILKSKFGSQPHFRLLHQSILDFIPDKNYKIVGNLPYNLTSPILRKLSEWTNWKEAVVMVQKEVGNRLASAVGEPDYGALTVGMSLTACMTKIFDLSPASFDPPPRVFSSVIRLERLEQPLTKEIFKTQRVIQAAFQQRRKMIVNSLAHGLSLDRKEVEDVLKKLGVDPALRPERMSAETFVALTDEFLCQGHIK